MTSEKLSRALESRDVKEHGKSFFTHVNVLALYTKTGVVIPQDTRSITKIPQQHQLSSYSSMC